MCDPDSSFEMELERASSEREVQLHEVVPRDMLFKIKFKEANGKTFKFFEFLLKEGRSLPYELALKGKMCTFSQSLKLGVTDMDLISNDQAQNTFVFQESVSKTLVTAQLSDSFQDEIGNTSFSSGSENIVLEVHARKQTSAEITRKSIATPQNQTESDLKQDLPTKVHVGNVPEIMTQKDLLELFEEHGEIVSSTLQRSKSKKKGGGIAIISFKTKEEAEVAVDMLHGYKFAGTKTGCLVVSLDDPSHSVKISESGGGIAIQDDAEEEGEVPGYVLGANERTCTLEAILLDNKKPTSIAPFECFICQYKFLTIGRAVIHIEEIHPDWQTEKDSSSTVSQSEKRLGGVSGNINKNKNWFNVLTSTFQEAVVEHCSKRTRDAIKKNDDIKEVNDRRAVFNEVVNETVTYLGTFFGSETPKRSHASKVVDLLASVYPALFKDDGMDPATSAYTGYGLGGLRGVRGLPERICDRFRDKVRKSKKSSEGLLHDEEAPPKKKGKQKLVFGVNNKKWYQECNSNSSIENLKLATEVKEYEEREAIFEENRPALMKMIRSSKLMIAKVCGGLFDDWRHLLKLFMYLTDSSIYEDIQNSFEGHLENMELYLLSLNSSLEFTEKLQRVKDECSVDFDGSKLHKYISILRMAAIQFDEDPSAIMRIQEDGEPVSSSPHMFAVKVGRSYVFELWVEKQRILEQLDMAQCIASFLHLVFTFDLKFPKNAETVCDFLQRVVADYGTDEGTKTHKSKTTAESRLIRYQVQLGKVLGKKNAQK